MVPYEDQGNNNNNLRRRRECDEPHHKSKQSLFLKRSRICRVKQTVARCAGLALIASEQSIFGFVWDVGFYLDCRCWEDQHLNIASSKQTPEAQRSLKR